MLTRTETETGETEGPPSLANRGKSLLAAARKNWLWLALGAVVLIVLFSIFGNHKPTEPYRTAKIDRGTITRVVSEPGCTSHGLAGSRCRGGSFRNRFMP